MVFSGLRGCVCGSSVWTPWTRPQRGRQTDHSVHPQEQVASVDRLVQTALAGCRCSCIKVKTLHDSGPASAHLCLVPSPLWVILALSSRAGSSVPCTLGLLLPEVMSMAAKGWLPWQTSDQLAQSHHPGASRDCQYLLSEESFLPGRYCRPNY